tara:strand:+ start:2423 stop:3298 length:876 start_codon:yes stop_codon:yes gene_type:complete
MENFDRIIFGDNQFFGINHMSQEKAQQLSEKFYDFQAIVDVYSIAINAGIRGIMLNSNDRASEICDYFVSNKSKYPELNWYPSIPYPHKYANLISEKGIIPTVNEVLFKNNNTMGLVGTIVKGGTALIGKDAIKLLQLLVDFEMKIFKNLNVRVVFLQNIITDLLLGYDVKDIFFEYCEHIRKQYNATPGLITQNMPMLKDKLENWGIHNVVICSSFNKIGYLMSPDLDTNIKSAKVNDNSKYHLMAMSTLASGAIPAEDAFEFVNRQNIGSIVFGASSRQNIEQTVSLIK